MTMNLPDLMLNPRLNIMQYEGGRRGETFRPLLYIAYSCGETLLYIAYSWGDAPLLKTIWNGEILRC